MVKDIEVYQFNNHFYKFQYNYSKKFMELTQIYFYDPLASLV
jgi:hypothetical protein